MRIRHALSTGVALLSLIAAPALAATFSGKVIAVDENSITVMKDGQATVYLLPPDLEVRTKAQAEPLAIQQLQGRTVTLTFDEPMATAGGEQQGAETAKVQPRVTNIRVDGDVDIDSDSEVEDDD